MALVGCDPAATEPTPDTPAATEPATKAPAPSATEEEPAEKKAVPDFVGMGLQSAQDAAHHQQP
ncbi:hypothetical protein ACFXKK_28715 [Streptomyces globisporus]|uniref:hypothetical protein n=1 Tax=Streptomyces globisporus TaxID=1908 RepID=UPI00365523E1